MIMFLVILLGLIYFYLSAWMLVARNLLVWCIFTSVMVFIFWVLLAPTKDSKKVKNPVALKIGDSFGNVNGILMKIIFWGILFCVVAIVAGYGILLFREF